MAGKSNLPSEFQDKDACGNCKFWNPQDPKGEIGACYGVPPTPILVAARPRQFGAGVEMQFEAIRPALRAAELPCSLHQRKLHLQVPILGPTEKN